MVNKLSLVLLFLFVPGFFLYGGFFQDSTAEAETIESFDQDTRFEYLDSIEGDPVYMTTPVLNSLIYYEGETYGQNYKEPYGVSLIDDKVFYEAYTENRNLLISDGKVIANASDTIKEYDMLNDSPVYISGGYEKNDTLYRGDTAVRNFSNVENMKVIDGEIAVLYSKDYDSYVWYGGSVIDNDATYGKLLNYKGKPIYPTMEDLEYGLAIEGEKIETNGSVDNFRVINNQLAVSYDSGEKYLGQKDISYCDGLYKVTIVDEKIACTGPEREKIYYGGEPIESKYDGLRKPFEYNGSLAYLANWRGSSFIVSDGKILTEKYSSIADAFYRNGSLYFSGIKKGSTGVYRDGKKMTDHRHTYLRSQNAPLIEAIKLEINLYRDQKLLLEANGVEKPVFNEKGLTYQYFKDGKSTLVTPEKNITRYGVIRDYAYGNKGLAYIAHEDGREFLVYDGQEGKNFSSIGQIQVINDTLYFLGERKDQKLLMEGHKVHTNLSENPRPDFFDKDGDQKEYERIGQDGKTFIKYEGKKYGPIDLPELNVTATTGNNQLILITQEGSSQYLRHEGKKYGPYEKIGERTIGEEKIFFTALENDKLKLKQIPI